MQPPGPSQSGISRPRQSLSCFVCKRRKVRCGREQPACSNCLRTHETCQYEHDILDRATRQKKRKPASDKPSYETGTGRPSPTAEEPWPDWTAQDDRPPASGNARSSDGERVDEADEWPREQTASDDSLQSSSPLDHQHSSSSGSSHFSSAQAPPSLINPFIPQSRSHEMSSTSSSIPSWNRATIDEPGHRPQLVTPSPTFSTIREISTYDTAHKRRRKVEISRSTKDSDQSQERSLDTHTNSQDRGIATTIPGTSEVDEDWNRRHGYLSVRSGGRIRHVAGGFWGLIKGHVSCGPSFTLISFLGHIVMFFSGVGL